MLRHRTLPLLGLLNLLLQAAQMLVVAFILLAQVLHILIEVAALLRQHVRHLGQGHRTLILAALLVLQLINRLLLSRFCLRRRWLVILAGTLINGFGMGTLVLGASVASSNSRCIFAT